MNPPKRQLFPVVLKLHRTSRKGKAKSGGKEKPSSRTKDTKKRATPKEPRQKKTPLTPKEKRENQRLRDYAARENSKAIGQCRKCEERAIPGQTRCEEHAEEHRAWRREYDRNRYAATKKSKSADTSTDQQSNTAPRPSADSQRIETNGEPTHESS